MSGTHPSYWARVSPDRAAYIVANTDRTVTFSELEERSNQIAHLFRARGLKPGDHIALQMENNEYFFQISWGAQRAGLIYTPIHSHLQRDEVEYILDNCKARLFITSGKMRDIAIALRREKIPVEHFFMLNGEASSYEDFLAAVAAQPTTPIADQVAGAHMMYSSGTTGHPKGILPNWTPAKFDDMPAMLLASSKWAGYTAGSVYLTPAPLYHAAPMVSGMCCMAMGGTVVILEKFDAELALASIERYRVSMSQWVPIMFTRMLRLPPEIRNKYDLSSHKKAIHAAAPCPADIKRQMIDWWGPIIFEYYAASEAIGQTGIDSHEWLAHPGSVGKAVLGVLHICDDDGNELPVGATGTIYFSGMQEFEYYGEPEKTRASRHSKGWATTGDVGYLDADGYLYLTDRKHFMIISGGVNIYPQEIENLLSSHPKIADVAVFGVPSEQFGEEVKAVVQPAIWADAGPALEQELLQWCRERLSHVKCPRSVDFEKELPRMDNGKLYKTQLRARYWP
ncbi:MAG: acyl-CoA synthetase [Spongiibacteraceae bacterium]